MNRQHPQLAHGCFPRNCSPAFVSWTSPRHVLDALLRPFRCDVRRRSLPGILPSKPTTLGAGPGWPRDRQPGRTRGSLAPGGGGQGGEADGDRTVRGGPGSFDRRVGASSGDTLASWGTTDRSARRGCDLDSAGTRQSSVTDGKKGIGMGGSSRPKAGREGGGRRHTCAGEAGRGSSGRKTKSVPLGTFSMAPSARNNLGWAQLRTCERQTRTPNVLNGFRKSVSNATDGLGGWGRTPPPLFLHRVGGVAVEAVEPRKDLPRRCCSN